MLLSSTSCILLSLFPLILSRKNIVLIITDDQDVELGSMEYMPKTKKLLKEKGIEFSNGFVTTPICCPSRSTILTGVYVHNHNIHTNNNNCSGTDWKNNYENRTFGVYLQNAGYKTAYFGKYLNGYEGKHIPKGWSHWFGLIRNSRFYNYTLRINSRQEKHGFKYEEDYLSDVVTNASLSWLSRHIENSNAPFFSVISYPAPHGPEDPAPKFAKLFENEHSHRTQAWNYAPNPDKQWILQRTGKMEPIHVAFTDILQRRRLQTLQSVDEAIQKLVSMLRNFGMLQNTYFLFTSDHGYHLGQFGLIKGKNMPYEFDIKVPFLMRGPGLPKNITVKNPVANIDIAPTILNMAEIEIPSDMDGRSLLDLFSGYNSSSKLTPWRDTVLIERGKMPKLKKITERWKIQKAKFNKLKRLNKQCNSGKWTGPCSQKQLWKCYISDDGRWRIYKCRQADFECQCDRQKRNIDDQESLIDEFLRHAYNQELNNSTEWKQGVFPEVLRRKRGSDCECIVNGTTGDHPLNDLDEYSDIEENIFLKNKNCSLPQMNCFKHSASHWRTPPFWPNEFGDFCFCQNSNNNTYWCLRTVNATHNFLYCEFVTGFLSYYDLYKDPYQLTNVIFTLEAKVLEELSGQLKLLRRCRGWPECELAGGSRPMLAPKLN